MQEQPKTTELDRVINYCDKLAAQARQAKANGPATLQALALHRIACALEGMADEIADSAEEVQHLRRVAAGDSENPFTEGEDDGDEGEVTP